MISIRTKVVHSHSKSAWNVIGTIVGSKRIIARCPYFLVNNDENHITSVRNKYEALEHALFISDAFNSDAFNKENQIKEKFEEIKTP